MPIPQTAQKVMTLLAVKIQKIPEMALKMEVMAQMTEVILKNKSL